MGQMFGVDPDQLDQLSKLMSNAAGHLDTICRDIDARLFCSIWAGHDAANNNATQQEQASS